MTKKEMDLLLGVLKNYVDTRICEIVSPTNRVKDPSETVALLWHKFEIEYLKHFAGNSTPLTHTVFRDFLHWLDDAMDELEKVLKAYTKDEIAKKFADIKLATTLYVFKDSNTNKWYIELRDQENNTMGDSYLLPFPIITADEGSGIEVVGNPTDGSYNIKIKTEGKDTATKRYMKTDNAGAYVKMDYINPILTDGEKIATLTRGSNDKDVDVFAPTPLIPSANNLTEGNEFRKVLGKYGDETVYYDDKECTFEGHYDVDSQANMPNQKPLIPTGDNKRRVVTALTVDLNGHFISGKYAEVNADGTLGEDIDINLPTPEEPEEPIEPEPTLLFCNVAMKIVDTANSNLVLKQDLKTYSGYQGDEISLAAQKQRILQAIENYEEYTLLTEPWGASGEPQSFIMDASNPSLEYIAYAKKAEQEAQPASVKIVAQLVEKATGTVKYSASFDIDGYIGQTKPIDKSRLNITDWFDDHDDFESMEEWKDGKTIPDEIELTKSETITYILFCRKKVVVPMVTLVYKDNNKEVARTDAFAITSLRIGDTIVPSNRQEIDQDALDWVMNNGYLDDYTFTPNSLTLEAENTIVVNVNPRVVAKPNVSLLFKLNGKSVKSVNVEESVINARIGDTISPQENVELNRQILAWLQENNYDVTNYSFESLNIVVTADTKIVVNIHAKVESNGYNSNESYHVSSPGEDVFSQENLPNGNVTESIALPVYDNSAITNNVPTLPIYMDVTHNMETIGNPDQGEREVWTAIVGIHADWSKFNEFNGNVEANIEMRDGSSYHLDLTSNDFADNKRHKYVTIEQTSVNIPCVTNINIRYNFTFKLK